MELYGDNESERALICAVLLDNACLETLCGVISSDDFFLARHRSIWSSIVDLHRSGAKADLVSVVSEARKYDADVDVAYIAGLTSVVSSSANVSHYAGVVKDLSTKRALRILASLSNELIADAGLKGLEIAGRIEKRLDEIMHGACVNDYKKAGKFLPELCDELDQNNKPNAEPRGIMSYYNSIDSRLIFRNQEYIIIGARPSIGKTAFVTSLIENIAIRNRKSVGVFSIEMSAKQILKRIISSMTGINSWRLDKGPYSPRELSLISETMETIYEAPIYIDDTGGIRLSELRAKMRRMVYNDKVKIIFIDYLSLINAEQPKLPRHEQIADINRAMKEVVKELNIPVVMLSQVTRDSEGKAPSLASLRESGTSEQDADVVLFLHRERDTDTDEIDTQLIIAKQRNGPTGICDMVYKPKMTRFECKGER